MRKKRADREHREHARHELIPDIAREKYRLQRRDEIARRDDVSDDLQPSRHAADLEQEPRQHERWKKPGLRGRLCRTELPVGAVDINKPCPNAGTRNAEARENNAKYEPLSGTPNACVASSVQPNIASRPESEVRQQLAEQDLQHAYRRRHHRLHRAALPFARDDERSKQCADQRHDDRDRAGYQIMAAVDFRVEPEACFQRNGRQPSMHCGRSPTLRRHRARKLRRNWRCSAAIRP